MSPDGPSVTACACGRRLLRELDAGDDGVEHGERLFQADERGNEQVRVVDDVRFPRGVRRWRSGTFTV